MSTVSEGPRLLTPETSATPPPGRDPSSLAFRLIWLSLLVLAAVITGVCAGALSRALGADPADALAHGGAAFTAVMFIGLGVIAYLSSTTPRSCNGQ